MQPHRQHKSGVLNGVNHGLQSIGNHGAATSQKIGWNQPPLRQ